MQTNLETLIISDLKQEQRAIIESLCANIIENCVKFVYESECLVDRKTQS